MIAPLVRRDFNIPLHTTHVTLQPTPYQAGLRSLNDFLRAYGTCRFPYILIQNPFDTGKKAHRAKHMFTSPSRVDAFSGLWMAGAY